MIWVAELTVKLVALVVPNLTAVAPVRLAPVMVTWVPPAAGPLAGEIPVTVGAAGGEVAVHCAYSVTLAAPMVRVEAAAFAVPLPSAAVFQPLKVPPVFTRVPVLPRTVTVAPWMYGLLLSVGTEPEVAPLPS